MYSSSDMSNIGTCPHPFTLPASLSHFLFLLVKFDFICPNLSTCTALISILISDFLFLILFVLLSSYLLPLPLDFFFIILGCCFPSSFLILFISALRFLYFFVQFSLHDLDEIARLMKSRETCILRTFWTTRCSRDTWIRVETVKLRKQSWDGLWTNGSCSLGPHTVRGFRLGSRR